MTHNNDNDFKLVNFISKHRASVPPSSPDLEDRILQQVAQTTKENVVPFSYPFRGCRWLVPSAIAAGLLAGVISYRNVMIQQPSAAELRNLEAFMENNWHGSVSNHPEEDVLQVTE